MLARLLLALVVVSVLAVLGGAGSVYGGYAQLTNSLKPRLDELQTQANKFQTTRIFDRNGTLLYEFFGAGKRTRIPLDQIAPDLKNATIAIEDKTFFENAGVDYEGLARTLLTNLQAGEEVGGGSTITQQLIKSVVLNDEERAYENRYQRKMTEIILAQELSRQYDKEQILELYLNEIYYGNLAYGIQAASDVYFDKSAGDLSLAESALLAGLPQLPSAYDPINYLENDTLKGVRLSNDWLTSDAALPDNLAPPKWRQIAVLRQMVDEGYATAQAARQAAEQDLRFAPQEVPLNAPHFVFYVRKLLEEDPRFGQNFANMGLSVYTSLDLNLQRTVQEKARERIQELEERNIHNAAVVVMQPNTGAILAMVGSIDYNSVKPSRTPDQDGNVLDGQVNVTTRERQPGSALKPFTYLSAMEQGMTPATVLWDVPTEFLGGVEPYAPKNYNGKWNGPVRMRMALANSLNMPAVKALKYAGVANTLDLLHRIGITGLQRDENYYGLALTLGGGEVTPLDLTTAYNTLASDGYYYPPVAITKIVGGDGEVIEEFTPPERLDSPDPTKVSDPEPGQQVLKPDHVAIISNMMSDDTARKPVWGLDSKLKLSRPAAVKTGTSNDWRDAWAVGYTPYVTVGVWTGNNNNEETAKVESITGGGAIWNSVMEEMFVNPDFSKILMEPYQGRELPMEFKVPETVERKEICALPGAFGGSKEELFTLDMTKPRALTITNGIMFGPSVTPEPASRRFGCDFQSSITVAKLGEVTETVSGTVSVANYCRPIDGVEVPPEMLTTISRWKLPPNDPSEKISYAGFAGGDISAGQIPACTNELIASVAPPGSVRMPDLRYFGENQAKEQLAALGVGPGQIYVDYQSRSKIPDVYDQFAPYAVVSTIPRAGEWIRPGELVILGVRAPDEPPPSAPQPDQPADQPAPAEQPTPQPEEDKDDDDDDD
jgi:peptidoglycan glycosyltransferase